MPADGAPLIARIAGLPASTLEHFSSDLCSRELPVIRTLLAELEAARSHLSDGLHEAVPGSPAPVRRILLALRRDCFNGRPLGRYRDMPAWSELCVRSRLLLEAVMHLEDRLSTARACLATGYVRERERERRSVLHLLENAGLRRGIALASPDSIENLPRLQKAPIERYGRKELRLETTLVRYLTRAAFKVSPYSTLTRLGLGVVQNAPSSGALCLQGAGWEERSLVRLKRYLLDQLWDLLRRYPPFRDGLQVELNDTIEEIELRRFHFMRPSFWTFDPDRNRFVYQVASLVKATLDGPVVDWLLREFPARKITYGELHRLFAADQAVIERLVHLGFLCLQAPWSIHAPQLEFDILSYLRTLPPDPGSAPLIDILNRLVHLERSFPTETAPARSVQEMEALIDRMWEVAAPLGGLAPDVHRRRLRTGNLYEDVFVAASGPEREVLRVQGATVQRLQNTLAPVERFLGLFNRYHDFRLTLAAFAAERWPGRTRMDVLELLGAIRPLWRDFSQFLAPVRLSGENVETFNPLGIEDLDRLARLRKEVWRGAAACVEASSDGLHLRREAFAVLVDRIPESYRPTMGSCLFLQPGDREGKYWILNRLSEGTGRYSSRYTAVMGDGQLAYTAHLMARSWDNTGAEILDITYPQGDTLNLHALQTQRRLGLPGEPLYLPPARCVGLRDLIVRFHGAGIPPDLVDRQGRRCRPVLLGGTGYDFFPTFLKILAVFGPGEMRFRFPKQTQQVQENMTVLERLTLDGIVLRRKRWFLAPNPLAGELELHTDAEAFEAINRWRLELGLPERVFFIERIHHESTEERYKPQYLDFTSPTLTALFRSSLRQNAESLTLEEMLPAPHVMPEDEQGHSWAVEILLEDVSLQEPGPVVPSSSSDSHLVEQVVASIT